MKTMVKSRAAIAIVAAMASLGGCTVIDAEKNTSGGYLGHLADEYIMAADTPEAEVYRALAVTAALALAAERNAVNHGNIKQAVDQITGITDSLNALYSQATSPCGLPENSKARNRAKSLHDSDADKPDCLLERPVAKKGETADKAAVSVPAYSTGFQVQLYRVNKQFFNLAAVALPENEFKAMINNAVSGNYLSLFKDLFVLAREVVLTAAPAFAGMRSGKQGRVHGFEEIVYDKDNQPHPAQHPQAINIVTGSYGEAAKIINADMGVMTTLKYPTKEVMYGLFREVQQSCLMMMTRLPASQITNVKCPQVFLGKELPFKGLYGAEDVKKPAASR